MSSSLQTYLEAEEGAGKVLAHARLLVRLAALYQDIAPPHLAQASRLANFKSGIIVINAGTGTVAAKLRQMAPTLVDALAKHGLECRGVQVKVQAAVAHEPPRPAAQKPLSARTSERLAALGASLPASPLRDAIGTLLVRAAREE